MMMGVLQLLTAVVPALSAIERVTDDTPFNQVPMLQAHDAASGYLRNSLVNNWAKTQSCTMYDQLQNGARSFDPRLIVINGELKYNHGPVDIDHLFEDSLAELTRWASENPDQLVTLPISKGSCDGTGCIGMVDDALERFGVPNVKHCSELTGMTFGEAKERARLPGGGMLLAITGNSQPTGVACSYGNYRPRNGCSGFSLPGQRRYPAAIDACFAQSGVDPSAVLEPEQVRGLTECASTLLAAASTNATLAADVKAATAAAYTYGCWQTDETKRRPFDRLFDSLDQVSAAAVLRPPWYNETYNFQLQAFWQETGESMVLGQLRFSSLVKDENRAELNKNLAAAVLEGRWERINYFMVNNVCNNGLDIFAALQHVFGPY